MTWRGQRSHNRLLTRCFADSKRLKIAVFGYKRNAFLLIKTPVGHAEDKRYTKVNTRRHQQTEGQASILGEEQRIHDEGNEGWHEELRRLDEEAGASYRTTWQKVSQERKTETQRVQPLP